MKPTREQVIAWAREAGISTPWDQEPVPWKLLTGFATLAYEAGRKDVNTELVEACQLVIRAYNKLQPASSNQGKDPLEIFAIRAALAKARGENND